jgi:Xaa-Pro aminopeptidase
MDENRSTTPVSSHFRDFIGSGWAQRDELEPAQRPVASCTPSRRERLSATFAGERLVIAAGALKVRSNDTDYAYRAHSDFSYLTGWG